MNPTLNERLIDFIHLLRGAGIKISAHRALPIAQTLPLISITQREDFYWMLHSLLVSNPNDHLLFDEAFHLFWQKRNSFDQILSLLLPTAQIPQAARPISPRLLPAFSEEDTVKKEMEREIEIDLALAPSAEEILHHTDFEKMSPQEVEEAKRAMALLPYAFDPLLHRRWESSVRRAAIDPRASFRKAMREAHGLPLCFRKRSLKHPPLVVLCDISGSMSRYSRLALHFLYFLSRHRRNVHTFLFGTKLSNVTRWLRDRDGDIAIDTIATKVQDWSGGTRIGANIQEFNRLWARRVLSQKATLLILTDGLERGDPNELKRELQRLKRSCHHLIWLNPLLRYGGYEAKAQGAAILSHYADEIRPVHNLQSLEQLLLALRKEASHDRRYSFLSSNLAA